MVYGLLLVARARRTWGTLRARIPKSLLFGLVLSLDFCPFFQSRSIVLLYKNNLTDPYKM
jgi:hypothetical protein